MELTYSMYGKHTLKETYSLRFGLSTRARRVHLFWTRNRTQSDPDLPDRLYCPLRWFLGNMYRLISKTPRSIARKEIVLMAFDLNHCRNVPLTPMPMVIYQLTPHPVTLVTDSLTPTEPLPGATEMHSWTFDLGC